jgi:hypothetical protein
LPEVQCQQITDSRLSENHDDRTMVLPGGSRASRIDAQLRLGGAGLILMKRGTRFATTLYVP